MAASWSTVKPASTKKVSESSAPESGGGAMSSTWWPSARHSCTVLRSASCTAGTGLSPMSVSR
jgi:hypothetical protein